MIRIAFFDVGETLIHGGQPFAGVVDALTAIASFGTADGNPLFLGIVSDFHMPVPPPTEEKVAALEARYRDEVLEPSGLSRFFEPFDSRVTISSRAGVFKPDRKIFDVALARSGTGAALTECLFVTENAAHLEKCAELGMTPVHFGPGGDGMASFEDWVDGPAVIAALIAPGQTENTAAALRPMLADRHGLVGFRQLDVAGRTIQGQASKLIQLNDPKLGPLDGIYVERPTEVTVELGPDGRVANVAAAPPGPDEVADAVNFVSSLVKSRSVAIPGQPPSEFRGTHSIETDAAGRRRLVRRRYSAL